MKRAFILLAVLILIPTSAVLSQTFLDYVLEMRGDTAVIKDYFDMNQEANSLYNAMLADTLARPEGRVYMLHAFGYYPLINNPSPATPTVIVGENSTIMVNNNDVNQTPPVVCGFAPEGVSANTGGINPSANLTVKNCSFIPATSKQDLGWNFFWTNVDDVNITYENCMFERTRWVFMATAAKGCSWFIKDCYFVNMNGQPCRRNGGVIDFFNTEDTIWVENSTHVNAQGLMYKLRANPCTRVVMNHNTFINMSSYILLDLGSQSGMSVTNNIFVNCQVQPYGPKNADPGENDIDKMPEGIINVYPDTSVHIDRKILVDKNVIYWDPRLADVPALANAQQINQSTEWVSQMITMNSRTQAMFNDNATYPYLTEGQWITELPNFTDSKDLLTTQVDNLKAFSIATCDTLSTDVMPDWRLVSSGPDSYIFSDFPIPVDLSYNNTNLLTAATNGFPVGDLNWFPTIKTQWLAQRDAEYAAIHSALQTGVLGVKELGGLPVDFKLQQNYPNPFNPTTNITFSLPKAGNVTLKVYDAIGNEVATLINGYLTAQSYNAEFNAAGVASGVYIYKLEYDNRSFSKKMVLMK